MPTQQKVGPEIELRLWTMAGDLGWKLGPQDAPSFSIFLPGAISSTSKPGSAIRNGVFEWVHMA